MPRRSNNKEGLVQHTYFLYEGFAAMVAIWSLLPNAGVTRNFWEDVAAVSLSVATCCLQERPGEVVAERTVLIPNERYFWPHCYEWCLKQAERG